MTRQIAPGFGAAPTPLLEERILRIEVRLQQIETKLALLTRALEALAETTPAQDDPEAWARETAGKAR